MTPDDRERARKALESGELTLSQVTAIREECERTGRPFAGLAARPAPSFNLLLPASAVIVSVLFAGTWITLRDKWETDARKAAEAARIHSRADLLEQQVRIDYHRRRSQARAKEAQETLAKARAALAQAEELHRTAPSEPESYLKAAEATAAFTSYLEIQGDDAAVLVERARSWELRGSRNRAAADLEKALDQRPSMEPTLLPKIRALRGQ